MNRSMIAVIAAVGSLLIAGNAVAQTPDHSKMDHSKMDHSKMAPAQSATADQSPSSQAFREANDRMHRDMTMSFTGNADVDFVKGMLPHHQGAVDMAKIVRKHGKDAKVRKLAQEIIKAQNTEIAWMRTWLAKNVK